MRLTTVVSFVAVLIVSIISPYIVAANNTTKILHDGLNVTDNLDTNVSIGASQLLVAATDNKELSKKSGRKHRQIPKHSDQITASSGHQSYNNQHNEKPRSYSVSYDSGPQYYESTSKPVRYYREYHSPPSSYSHSYNTGPQGSSYQSPPQHHSQRNSYNHQSGNEHSDGDSSSTGDHQSYGNDHGDGDEHYGGGGDEYGASDSDHDFENNDDSYGAGDHSDSENSIEY